MYCTVHFVITLLNVGNVLLWVVYQLNVIVFMYVTQVSHVIYSVLYYPRFHVTAVGLGTYYSWVIRGHYSAILKQSVSAVKFWMVDRGGLLGWMNGRIFQVQK
jgi:hypothetical protein